MADEKAAGGAGLSVDCMVRPRNRWVRVSIGLGVVGEDRVAGETGSGERWAGGTGV